MLEHSSLLYPGREDTFRRSLAQLRQDIMKANTLVREANIFADEMGKQTTFGVTLQIPPQNLSPNRKRSAFVSEPAILVKRKGKPNQVNDLFTCCLFTILVVWCKPFLVFVVSVYTDTHVARYLRGHKKK